MTDIATLATVAGAVPAAFIVVEFIKRLVAMEPSTIRVVSACTGLAIVVIATALQAEFTVSTYLLAVLVGAEAGVAASQLQENLSNGLDHVTMSQDELEVSMKAARDFARVQALEEVRRSG